MPPTTRRTISAPSTPPNHNLQFSLFGPSHLPITPTRPRRPHSSSSSPYPSGRTAIDQARTSSRSADGTRRILGEIDWWVVMSGQKDEEEEEEEYEEEEEEEEWETMPVEDAQPVEEPTSSVPVETISHNDQEDDDTISENSDSEASVYSDAAATPNPYETSPAEDEPEERVSSLFFPTTFPPLTNILSSQVGSEPSRRASSRSTSSRPYNNRPSTSTLTWDYSTSSMMVTSSATPPSPSPPPPPTTRAATTAAAAAAACRSSPRRATSVGIAAGSVADNIIRDALALTSPPTSPGPIKTNMNFLRLKKFPMAALMVSPSILTFR